MATRSSSIAVTCPASPLSTPSMRALRRATTRSPMAKGPGVRDQLVWPQPTGRPQALSSAPVELCNVASAVGDHDCALAIRERPEPVVDKAMTHRRRRRRGHDAAVLRVLAGEQIDIAVA